MRVVVNHKLGGGEGGGDLGICIWVRGTVTEISILLGWKVPFGGVHPQLGWPWLTVDGGNATASVVTGCSEVHDG